MPRTSAILTLFLAAVRIADGLYFDGRRLSAPSLDFLGFPSPPASNFLQQPLAQFEADIAPTVNLNGLLRQTVGSESGSETGSLGKFLSQEAIRRCGECRWLLQCLVCGKSM